MDLAKKLHINGLTLNQILGVIDEKISELTGNKLIDYINLFSEKISQKKEASFYYELLELDHRNITYQQQIQDLLNTLLDGLYGLGKKGEIVAVAYNCINNHNPVIVQPHEWAFLKIDTDNNSANYRDKQYVDLKFIQPERLSSNELDQLKKLIGNNQVSNVKPIETDLNKEHPSGDNIEKKQKQNKNSKRKDNLTKAISAAIAEFNKKPSLEELWLYFQKDKDNTGFIVDFSDQKLTWRDTKGNLQDTKKGSVANRLSRIKI